MAILSFKKSDRMSASIMPAGFYSFEVIEIGEPKKSGSGKSMNMHSVFHVIDDEDYEGKEQKVTFNTGMDRPSVMGSMVLLPHTWLLQLAAATANVDIKDVPDDLDTESLKGLKFDAKVEKVIIEGVVLNTVSAFYPFGAGKHKEEAELPF